MQVRVGQIVHELMIEEICLVGVPGDVGLGDWIGSAEARGFAGFRSFA